jgi:hypothetical protein
VAEGVPVDDTLANEGDKAIADLPEQAKGFGLGDLRVRVDVFLEVAVADLLNDVVVVAALHDVQHADHVVGLEQLQDLYL